MAVSDAPIIASGTRAPIAGRCFASQILARVFAGLKDRLLAPELVETFVAEYVTEVNLANRNATSPTLEAGDGAGAR